LITRALLRTSRVSLMLIVIAIVVVVGDIRSATVIRVSGTRVDDDV
jgi:hypothetical protein